MKRHRLSPSPPSRSVPRRVPRGLALVATALLVGLSILASAPRTASSFCGFYVSGGGADLYNNATIVVMMRAGSRTVLSMQNNYEGPPEAFALVVPVPVVLQEDNVKILESAVFDRVDQLAAPRLVEYWETDPCWRPEPVDENAVLAMEGGAAPPSEVRIEAQFSVGEYDVVILSADESTALDTWLRANDYQIPEGAEPVLRPYVQAGMKFFVAKVNVDRVTFENGQAMLSPLRFHYDTEDFSLPVRLGLLNAKGPQDLLVHILAPGQRYEVANYPNVTIPTNIDVAEAARDRFGEFYVALFDKTLEQNPGAVVTEYAWDASWCDPCPTPALSQGDLLTLGADVIPDGVGGLQSSFVLTRLHARYTADNLGEDLIFRAAPPIAGGRERPGRDGEIEHGSQPASTNTFQARYVIRHWWEGDVDCDEPIRGRWGGPEEGGGGRRSPEAAQNLAFAARGAVELAAMVRQDIPELAVEAEVEGGPPPIESGGCCLSCEQAAVAAPRGWAARLLTPLVLLGLYWAGRRRQRGDLR